MMSKEHEFHPVGFCYYLLPLFGKVRVSMQQVNEEGVSYEFWMNDKYQFSLMQTIDEYGYPGWRQANINYMVSPNIVNSEKPFFHGNTVELVNRELVYAVGKAIESHFIYSS